MTGLQQLPCGSPPALATQASGPFPAPGPSTSRPPPPPGAQCSLTLLSPIHSVSGFPRGHLCHRHPHSGAGSHLRPLWGSRWARGVPSGQRPGMSAGPDPQPWTPQRGRSPPPKYNRAQGRPAPQSGRPCLIPLGQWWANSLDNRAANRGDHSLRALFSLRARGQLDHNNRTGYGCCFRLRWALWETLVSAVPADLTLCLQGPPPLQGGRLPGPPEPQLWKAGDRSPGEPGPQPEEVPALPGAPAWMVVADASQGLPLLWLSHAWQRPRSGYPKPESPRPPHHTHNHDAFTSLAAGGWWLLTDAHHRPLSPSGPQSQREGGRGGCRGLRFPHPL